MKELSQAIKKAMSYDPIAEAERFMGKSYKEDDSVVWASMPLSQYNGQTKEELLTLNDDTHMGMKIPEWKRLLERLGFKLMIEDALSEGNFFRVYWNQEGFLLASDSYWGDKSVNGGSVYAFYRGDHKGIHINGGGGISPQKEEGLYVVNKDIREGLRWFIEELKAHGEVLPHWPHLPFVWLLSYEDTKVNGFDYKEISMRRIKRMPLEVQDCILGFHTN